jgi:hypothetical protein
MTADDQQPDWLTRMLSRPPLPQWEPDVPLCGCGVWMYAPDSQAAGMCFLCRKRTGQTEAAP